jgi:hypothetical protein
VSLVPRREHDVRHLAGFSKRRIGIPHEQDAVAQRKPLIGPLLHGLFERGLGDVDVPGSSDGPNVCGGLNKTRTSKARESKALKRAMSNAMAGRLQETFKNCVIFYGEFIEHGIERTEVGQSMRYACRPQNDGQRRSGSGTVIRRGNAAVLEVMTKAGRLYRSTSFRLTKKEAAELAAQLQKAVSSNQDSVLGN